MHSQESTYFDAHAETYADQITSIQQTFYRNSARILNEQLPEGGTVLDLGNGGVINYDYTRLGQLDCADIVVSQSAVERYADAANVRFFQADATDLSGISSGIYDAVILQTVIHHLAGPTLKKTDARVRSAVRECGRVLKPGGRLLIIESTVAPWFNAVERAAYPLMELFFRVCKFGCVYQFSPSALRDLLSQAEGVQLISDEKVDVGPSIWIMGHRVPTKLTPCGAYYYLLRKDDRQ